MDKHWRNFVNLSIVHFMAYPETIGGEGPIVETVSKIAEDPFFSAIEIGWIKDPAVRAQVKNIVDTSHILVGHGGQSALLLQKLNVNSLDEDERKKAVAQLFRSIDEAAEMGAKRVAFLTGVDPGDADRQRGLDQLAKTVAEASRYGQDKGIALTLETFDRSIDKKCLLGPSDLSAEFCKRMRVDFPDFGLLYDLSHMPLLSETSEQSLGTLKDYLVHIHIGNCVVEAGKPGYGDLHPRFGWPGGENDVPQVAEFVRMLFKIGYLSEGRTEKPWIGFEVKPQTANETSALVIANAKRVWMDAWALV